MDLPVTGRLRRARGFVRICATVLLAAFGNLCLQPLALALSQTPAAVARAALATPAANPGTSLSKTLDRLTEVLEKLEGKLNSQQDGSAESAELHSLTQSIKGPGSN